MSAEIGLVVEELEREGGRKRLAERRLKTAIFVREFCACLHMLGLSGSGLFV